MRATLPPKTPEQKVADLTAMGKAIVQAKELQKDLSDATDALNAALKDAEHAILDLNLGVRGEVKVSGYDDLKLIFGKHNAVWCLHFDKAGQHTIIQNAPREWRILATDLLTALVGQLAENVGLEVKRVDGAVATTDRFLDDLGVETEGST